MNTHKTFVQSYSLALFAIALCALFIFGTPRAHAAVTVEQIDEIEETINDIESSIYSILDQGEVLGASTFAEVPVRPACRLSTDKKVYVYQKDTIKVSWKGTGTAYAEFVPDDSGKDALTLPSGQLDSADSVEIPASVHGIPSITLKVTSETGHTSMCRKYIAVTDGSMTKGDNKVAALNAKKLALLNRIDRLNTKKEKISASLLQLELDAVAIDLKLQELINDTSIEKGIVLEANVTSALVDTNSPDEESDNEGVYTIKFDVTAVDQNVYIPKTASRGVSQTSGVTFRVLGTDGKPVTTGTASGGLSSTADTDGNYFVVSEGDSETFTLTVNYDPETSGFYGVGLTRVNYSATAAKPDAQAVAKPFADFVTDLINI